MKNKIKHPIIYLLTLIAILLFNTNSQALWLSPVSTIHKKVNAPDNFINLSPNGDGDGIVTITGNGGACVSEHHNGQVWQWDVKEGLSYHMVISEVSECSGDYITVFVQSASTGNFCLNAEKTGAGTYEADFTMPNPACETYPISYKCGQGAGCNNNDTWDAKGPGGQPMVHLRAAYFDPDCNYLSNDMDCSGGGNQPPGITCSTNGADLGCDPSELPEPDNSTVSVSEGSCGGLEITSSVSDVSTGCNHARVITYTVTDDCNRSASCSQTFTWSTSTEISIEADGPTTVCSDNCVTINATDGFASYAWYMNGNLIVGAGGASIDACESGSYSVTGTNECGCESSSNSIDITIVPTPTCDIRVPDPLPVCGLYNRELSVDITGDYTSIYWEVTSSDNSWIITSGQGTEMIKYTAGNKGVDATFSVVVTNSVNGLDCSSDCSVTFGTYCEEYCSYTQGFYGSTGKICDGSINALTAINFALGFGNMVMGCGTRTITILTSEGTCLNSKLPSGSTAALLPVGAKTCATATGTAYMKNGKFINVLLGQALALALNVRLDADLGFVEITDKYLTSYKASSCTNGIAVNGTKLVKLIPQSVLNCLGTNNSVNDLLALANKGLGGCLPGGCAATLPDLVVALTTINESFDKCRILAGFGSDPAGLRIKDLDENVASYNVGDIELSLQPNPVAGNTTISFVAPENSNASLDLYDFNGTAIKNLYNASVFADKSYGIRFDGSSVSPGIYLLRLTVGTQSGYTKMIIIK